MKTYKKTKLVICALITVLLCLLSLNTNAVELSNNPENGIVEIYSGLDDMNGAFYKIKNGSGFIVSNNDSGCYLITTYKCATVSSKEREDCIEAKANSTDNYGFNDSIKVVINGDVSTSVSIVAKSKKKNFAILRSENVINEKEPLRLGNSVEKDETVYSLGFIDSTDSIQYDANDVVKSVGNVNEANEIINGITYINHSAFVDNACSGGPLINEDGYVVGMNDSELSSGSYFALDIDSIKTILNNYSISYSSYDYDTAYSKFEKVYKKCQEICESGNYTAESIEALKKAMDEVQINMSDNPSTDEVLSATKTLSKAKSNLIEKTPTIRIVIYILIGVLVAAIIWLLCVLLRYRKITGSFKIKKSVKKIENSISSSNSSSEIKNEALSSTPPYTHRKQKIAYLQKLGDQTIIRIDKKSFSLGSKIGDVDCIIENRAVSRTHATIKYINGKFVIFDENSVNGTYVNDVIVEDEGKELTSGDIIALADEQLLFKEEF